MKKITAKFASKCAETGKAIKKGDQMFYNYETRKCYHLQSEAARVTETPPTNDFIQDPGETYFDNFCINNNI